MIDPGLYNVESPGSIRNKEPSPAPPEDGLTGKKSFWDRVGCGAAHTIPNPTKNQASSAKMRAGKLSS